MTEKKKKLKSLISTNKIDNYNEGGGRCGRKKEKNPKESIEQVKTFFWAPKSLQMVAAAMKLKDAYFLEGKL